MGLIHIYLSIVLNNSTMKHNIERHSGYCTAQCNRARSLALDSTTHNNTAVQQTTAQSSTAQCSTAHSTSQNIAHRTTHHRTAIPGQYTAHQNTAPHTVQYMNIQLYMSSEFRLIMNIHVLYRYIKLF